jgi:hypothetical protein
MLPLACKKNTECYVKTHLDRTKIWTSALIGSSARASREERVLQHAYEDARDRALGRKKTDISARGFMNAYRRTIKGKEFADFDPATFSDEHFKWLAGKLPNFQLADAKKLQKFKGAIQKLHASEEEEEDDAKNAKILSQLRSSQQELNEKLSHGYEQSDEEKESEENNKEEEIEIIQDSPKTLVEGYGDADDSPDEAEEPEPISEPETVS